MIKVSTDNEFIYSVLEKSSQLPREFDLSKVFGFDDMDDFCLVVYQSTSRDFILFRADNYIQNKDILVDLMEAVQEFSFHDYAGELKNEAIKLVENKLHSKNNSRFFFDAH